MKAFVQLSGMNTPQFAVKQLGLRLDDENVRAPTRLGSCSAKRASSASALTHQSMCSLQRQMLLELPARLVFDLKRTCPASSWGRLR